MTGPPCTSISFIKLANASAKFLGKEDRETFVQGKI